MWIVMWLMNRGFTSYYNWRFFFCKLCRCWGFFYNSMSNLLVYRWYFRDIWRLWARLVFHTYNRLLIILRLVWLFKSCLKRGLWNFIDIFKIPFLLNIFRLLILLLLFLFLFNCNLSSFLLLIFKIIWQKLLHQFIRSEWFLLLY